MSDVAYNSSLTVGIIFGSIGFFLVIFIIYLSCRQRLKQQQHEQMLTNSHSSQTPFIKKTQSTESHKSHLINVSEILYNCKTLLTELILLILMIINRWKMNKF